MSGCRGRSRSTARRVVFCLSLSLASLAPAQEALQGFTTGAAAQAWEQFNAGLQGVINRDADAAEAAFAALMEMDPSPLRVALLAEHAVQKTSAGGAVLLFEEDHKSDALGESGTKVADLLATGKEQMNQADDGFYFCQLGRFDVADANFKALLEAEPDPVAVLEFVERVPRRKDILIQAMLNPTLGESALAMLKLLDQGERAVLADPTRIRENVRRLGGPPRGFENAVDALKNSGEYAVPFLLEFLRTDKEQTLLRPILKSLPLLDRPGLNPLVMALRVEDETTKRYVIETLGKVGYHQAVPYLLQVLQGAGLAAETRSLAENAIAMIRSKQPSAVNDAAWTDPALAFLALAEGYYADLPSLRADPRLDTANVWYWREDMLQNVVVPRVIFNEIMTLRCCEEALKLQPDLKPALALWLAADFRREAQLAEGEADNTRPDNYPTAVYFAQSAGAEYCLMTLGRALDDADPAVALGAIEALRHTAGPAAIIAHDTARLPLAEALTFSDRMVRVQAGLTLAAANPQQAFPNSQNLMPALAEALALHAGGKAALVVAPDTELANKAAATLRNMGYEVTVADNVAGGLREARTGLPGLDAIVLASDVQPPLPEALAAIRSELFAAAAPVVIMTQPGQAEQVRDLVRSDHRLGEFGGEPTAGRLAKAIALTSKAVGMQPVTAEVGQALATQAAQALRQLGATNNTVFDLASVEPALLNALSTQDTELRLLLLDVLGYIGSAKAQEAIAEIALKADEPEETRVRVWTALAEAAKRRGNQLGASTIEKIVKAAESEPNLTLRTAASRALGALNLPGTPASAIIRNQYRG